MSRITSHLPPSAPFRSGPVRPEALLVTGADGLAIPGLRIGPCSVYFGQHNGKFPDGNQVVVQGPDSKLVFDTPLVANRLGPVLDGVDQVVLGHVHEDHTAGLHRMPQVPVAAPRADLPALQSLDGLARHYGYHGEVAQAALDNAQHHFHFVPRPDAQPYDDGTCWDLGGGVRVRALHMPGHTAGHSVLLVEPVGLAFIGDIELSGFGPYYGDACSNLADFRRSLVAVAEVPASVWVTSHHKGVVSDRAQFLDQLGRFAAVIDQREARLLDTLAERPMRLDELVARRFAYPPSFQAGWVGEVEARMLSQHLDELLQQGRVSCDEGGHYRAVQH